MPKWMWWLIVPEAFAAFGFAIFMAVRGFGGMHTLEGVATTFSTDVRAGHCDAAYARTSTAYRSMVALDRFCAAVSANAYLREASSVTFNELRTSGTSATARGTFHSDVGDVATVFDFTKEGAEYRIAG